MRQIDDVGGRNADLQAVDLALELVGDVAAAVGPRRLGGECAKYRKRRGEQDRSARASSEYHGGSPSSTSHKSLKRAGSARELSRSLLRKETQEGMIYAAVW